MQIINTIVSGGSLHDPAGPGIQVHEDGGDMVVTFSEEMAQELCFQEGDDVIWQISDDGQIRISIPQAEVRRQLRERVNDLLEGGPEL